MDTPAQLQRFLGTWRLLPERSRYASGQPPQRGLYRLEAADGGAVRFHVDYVDGSGESKQLEYTVPFQDGEGAGACLVDASTLDTTVRESGRVVAHARRVLSADGRTMTITQSGTAPDGQPFANVSAYAREDTP